MTTRTIPALVVILALAGCTRTWSADVTQPNPLIAPEETLPVSQTLDIVTGDKDLLTPGADRIRLHNTARFTVVSPDRVRVTVQLEHKWMERVRLHGWRAHLKDDRGRRYDPVDLDRASTRHVTWMWDYESYQAVETADGTQYRNTGMASLAHPLGSVTWYRGTGDFVFYADELMHLDAKSLTLVLERPGQRFVFSWKFADDDPASAVAKR